MGCLVQEVKGYKHLNSLFLHISCKVLMLCFESNIVYTASYFESLFPGCDWCLGKLLELCDLAGKSRSLGAVFKKVLCDPGYKQCSPHPDLPSANYPTSRPHFYGLSTVLPPILEWEEAWQKLFSSTDLSFLYSYFFKKKFRCNLKFVFIPVM